MSTHQPLFEQTHKVIILFAKKQTVIIIVMQTTKLNLDLSHSHVWDVLYQPAMDFFQEILSLILRALTAL